MAGVYPPRPAPTAAPVQLPYSLELPPTDNQARYRACGVTMGCWCRTNCASVRVHRAMARRAPWMVRLPVLRGEQQRGERFERRHELVELVGVEVLVGLGSEVIGERLDPLFDGAAGPRPAGGGGGGGGGGGWGGGGGLGGGGPRVGREKERPAAPPPPLIRP